MTDIIGLILSIAAIIVSVIVARKQFQANKNNNAIALEADIYFKIYYNFLVDEIPNAREYFLYSNKTLSGTKKLSDVLNDVRKASVFFKYRDREYYDELVAGLQDLEDYLTNSEGEMSHDDFAKFTREVNIRIENIYQMIMEECSGVRKRQRNKH